MSAEKKQFRLGLVGYGEIGSTLGRGLRGAGLESIASYDKYAFDGPYAELIQSRAQRGGRHTGALKPGTGGRRGSDLQRDAGLRFSRKCGSLRPLLDQPAHLHRLRLGDPQDQDGRRRAPGRHRRALGDGSIEGTPLHGYSMRMLSSGPAGERVRDMLVPWGMQIEFVGEKLGTASGIKILRSVLIKGIEALTDEMLLAARHYGIDEIVLASASKTLARPWMDTVQSLTPSGVIHAKRRAEELEMSAEAVADAGIEPIMARAVAARLRWKEGLGLKDHFKGVVPANYKEALDAIEMKMAEKGLMPVDH